MGEKGNMALKSVESQNVEFKSRWRDEYLKVISAFANTDGGVLILGVDDKGKPIGVENAKKLLEDVPNKIRDVLGIIPRVITENKRGKDILSIEVKPSYAPISYHGQEQYERLKYLASRRNLTNRLWTI